QGMRAPTAGTPWRRAAATVDRPAQGGAAAPRARGGRVAMSAGEPGLLESLRDVSVEELLLPLLVQLILIIAVARLCAILFRRIGQPGVVGEIAAGLMLGPSVLGWLAPDLFAMIFRPEVAGLSAPAADVLLSKILTTLSQLGLILLLFLVGLEFDFG